MNPYIDFDASTVRVITHQGTPYYLLSDVMNWLEQAATGLAATARDLPQSEVTSTRLLGIKGKVARPLVTERGMYRMVLRARGPVGLRLREWLIDTVLPSLHASGRYASPVLGEGKAAVAGRHPENLFGAYQPSEVGGAETKPAAASIGDRAGA